MKINSLKEKNIDISFDTWSDKAFKGTVVNRALPSLHGGWLEITALVPFRKFKKNIFPKKDTTVINWEGGGDRAYFPVFPGVLFNCVKLRLQSI